MKKIHIAYKKGWWSRLLKLYCKRDPMRNGYHFKVTKPVEEYCKTCLKEYYLKN